MKKHWTKLFCGAAVMAAVVGMPQPSAEAGLTAPTLASVQIRQQFRISESTLLDFGTFARPNVTGTAELSPVEGLIHCNLTSVGRKQPKAATISITALPSQTFGVAVGGKAQIGRDGSRLEISTFTHNAGATPVVDASGATLIKVGASLYVDKGTPNGVYKGNFDIIVSNN